MSRREQIETNLTAVRERIARACAAADRDPGEVTLIVVTKFHPVSDLAHLVDLGVTDIGENRDQEAGAKIAELDPATRAALTVHFIGQLQTNKAKHVVRYADCVQSVDRAKLVGALDRAVAGRIADSVGAPDGQQQNHYENAGSTSETTMKIGGGETGGLDVLLQVDLGEGEDAGRGGVLPADLVALADRVSVNLEAPTPERLQVLSRTKDYGRELWTALETAERTRRDERRRVSMTTQFVVGAAGEEDRELLDTAGRLYRDLGLARVYYSAFRPVSDTPLEGHAPAPLWRQNRLYQADMLLSLYGFTPDELVYDARGMLSRDDDPKVAWARAHPERFPVEVNRASKEDLLRVPGIGPTSAERIVRWRREGALTDLAQVGKAGAAAKRAAPYVLLNGRRPVHQMALW